MITINANTLDAAIGRAADFVKRGAVVRRCVRSPGKQWEVIVDWPDNLSHLADVQAVSERAQPASPETGGMVAVCTH